MEETVEENENEAANEAAGEDFARTDNASEEETI